MTCTSLRFLGMFDSGWWLLPSLWLRPGCGTFVDALHVAVFFTVPDVCCSGGLAGRASVLHLSAVGTQLPAAGSAPGVSHLVDGGDANLHPHQGGATPRIAPHGTVTAEAGFTHLTKALQEALPVVPPL